MAENTPQTAKASGNSTLRSRLPLIVLIIFLAIAAAGVAAGAASSSGATQLSCLSITHQGSGLQITTNGLVHISGTQYYVACPEGSNPVTSSTSVSCLTIAPQEHNFSYPDAAPYLWYYLVAPGHAITIPGAVANATEIIPPPDVTIQVSC